MFTDLFHKHRTELLRQSMEWFDRNRNRLLAYACQQADCSTDVELLLAKVARNVSHAFSQGGVKESALLPYAMRCVHNAAVAMRRENARRQTTELHYGNEASRNALAQESAFFEADDATQQLLDALRQLPEELYAIVTLKIWDELSYTQIAERLGLAKSTVHRRYLAAIAAIRKQITEHTHEKP